MTAPGVAEDVAKDIPLKLINFQLPPPRQLSEAERRAALQSAIARIREGAQDLGPPPEVPGQMAHVGLPASDMWMLLLVRMVTRAEVIEETVTDGEAKKKDDTQYGNDDRRRTLCNYVLEDFPARLAVFRFGFRFCLSKGFMQNTIGHCLDE